MKLRMMIVHVLLNYDIGLENRETRPSNLIKDIGILPYTTSKILFKEHMVE